MSDDKQSNNDNASETDSGKQEEALQADMTARQEIDWTKDKLHSHPQGMDSAIAENRARMEKQTLDLIANGTIDEIEAALEKNLEQLAALQKHIEKLTGGNSTKL